MIGLNIAPDYNKYKDVIRSFTNILPGFDLSNYVAGTHDIFRNLTVSARVDRVTATKLIINFHMKNVFSNK